MYIGTAMKNREYGSWLGVITAANVTIHDDRPAPPLAQLLRGQDAGEQQEHQDARGTRTTIPNATIISATSEMYLSAVSSG